MKETKAPEGYLLDSNTYNVSLLYKDQNSKVVTGSIISKDKVKKRQVNIFKSGIKILSGVVPGIHMKKFGEALISMEIMFMLIQIELKKHKKLLQQFQRLQQIKMEMLIQKCCHMVNMS